MDGSRFDEVTRRFVTARSRRGVLAAALAALGGGLSIDTVAAGPRPKHRNVCRALGDGCTRDSQCCDRRCNVGRHLPRSQRNRCGCPAGHTLCDGACVDAATDVTNCGACGVVCNSAQVCISGACDCANDLTECAGACVDTDTDEANCGACDTACDTVNGEICDDGGCCGALHSACSTDADCCDIATVQCIDFFSARLCKKRNGQSCTTNDECFNNVCRAGVCIPD